MTRVADLAQNKLIQSLIVKTQDRLSKAQLQISTLQKSQNYAGIADDSSRLVTVESSRRRLQQFLNDNNFVELRINTMLNSMNSIKHSIKDVKDLLRDILDDGQLPSGIDKNSIAATKMSELEDFLNVKVNGRYLFAGSKTDTKPVQPGSLTSAPTYNGSFVTSAEPSFYYKGDDALVKARIDEGVVIDYGVKADDPAFEKAIRAIRILRSTDISGGDANYIAKIQGALDLINESEDALSAVELNTGTKLQQLDSTNRQLKDTKNFADGIISDLESANTSEAVAQLTRDQTMLEASYATVVRLSDLTLTNFLT